MALFKSGNPTLGEKAFDRAIYEGDQSVMTQSGTMNKFALMMLLVLGSASVTWKAAAEGVNVLPWVIGSAIGGIILAIVISFKPRFAPVAGPIYALVEGVFVGGISAYYNDIFSQIAPNLIMQAVGLTFGVVIAMYALYKFRVIKATERFKSVVFMATAGIAVFYLLAIILRFFGIQMPLIHDNSTWGILFSLAVVVIASLNLILDFDMIEQGAQRGAPKFMEWYGAFALVVTIIWLYIEILRLLSKMASRD